MLDFLLGTGQASERKLRLFSVACCRRIWHLMKDERSRRAVKATEQYVDRLAGKKELHAAWEAAVSVIWRGTPTRAARAAATAGAEVAATLMTVSASRNIVGAVTEAVRQPDRLDLSTCLRDIFGPLPFRTVTLPQSIRTWNDSLIIKLATAIYEERSLPSGTLDVRRMGVLGDALEEAGCTDQDILGHLRQQGAVHVRGCWLVDLLLGKS
jgi:hypothetical protein